MLTLQSFGPWVLVSSGIAPVSSHVAGANSSEKLTNLPAFHSRTRVVLKRRCLSPTGFKAESPVGQPWSPRISPNIPPVGIPHRLEYSADVVALVPAQQPSHL